ncbi:LLM class flavin-dependent oxidoreductase [Rhizorhabdus wittichii]|uniref:LLM class flavin-dependent oxidoreductase n=1 Tax=Rhizorhabdus wittichii TaxID=160791 RepID=A0A975D312_9SPHN|nr:LLM class flavin-dependent oxidoreductase [Rhizorhabdus wittichii]QTH22072.1 LLM class flavin-dependent oxidoreductase [Rhizorhabdus wittichii]
MKKNIEVGVFIPTVRSGWVHSSNVPYSPGSFKHALLVTQLAEFLGFDFVLSPQNWRGAQGPSRFWGDTVESLTTTAALLQATDRIKVWGTTHANVYPPAAIAKMVATLSEIGNGRVGMNVVTGGHRSSFEPLGLWDDSLSHDERYDYAEEWLQVIKKLWTDERVTHEGKFFQLNDAILSPRPRSMPTLVNAGASGRGLRFAVSSCDVAFLLGGGEAGYIESAKQAKQIAKELNKPDFKVYGLVTLVPGDSDRDAQALMDHLEEGVDLAGLEDLARGYEKNTKGVKQLSSSSLAPLGGPKYKSVMPGTFIGSYESLATQLSQQIIKADLDGLLVIVPDYINNLKEVAMRTFPLLEEHNIYCNVGAGL